MRKGASLQLTYYIVYIGIVVVGISVGAQTRIPAPAFTFSPTPKKCEADFLMMDSLSNLLNAPYTMFIPGHLRLIACKSGYFTVIFKGNRYNDFTPEIIIASKHDSSTLKINGKISKTFRLNSSEDLYLVYVEDKNVIEYREYFVSELRHSVFRCNPIIPLVVPTTGGVFDPFKNTFSAIFSVPITISSCADGIISFKVRGTSAQKEFPKISVRYDGQSKIIETDSYNKFFSFPVRKGDIDIRILNPFRRDIYDGKVSVESIVFKDEFHD